MIINQFLRETPKLPLFFAFDHQKSFRGCVCRPVFYCAAEALSEDENHFILHQQFHVRWLKQSHEMPTKINAIWDKTMAMRAGIQSRVFPQVNPSESYFNFHLMCVSHNIPFTSELYTFNIAWINVGTIRQWIYSSSHISLELRYFLRLCARQCDGSKIWNVKAVLLGIPNRSVFAVLAEDERKTRGRR